MERVRRLDATPTNLATSALPCSSHRFKPDAIVFAAGIGPSTWFEPISRMLSLRQRWAKARSSLPSRRPRDRSTGIRRGVRAH